MSSEAGRPRVVSLLGAATEVIYALGLQQLLVGRSHECKRPPSVLKVPCVSSPALGQHAEDVVSSGEIDSQIRVLVERGLARYEVDADLLKRLKPDMIISQDQCGVCAVSVHELEKACGQFVQGSCKLVSLKPLTVTDVFDNIQTIADACGAHTRGEVFVQQLKARWQDVRQRSPQGAEGMPPISVACLQWLDPLMGAGYWVPEIVGCAGGVNVFGDAGGPSPLISWHDLLLSDPDVVVVMCCGMGIEKAGKEMAELESHIEWRHLQAVKGERVYLVDGDRYFNNSGPSVVDSAELMAEILHGSGKDFGGASRYQGKGFVRWDTFVSLSFLGQRERGHTTQQRTCSPAEANKLIKLANKQPRQVQGEEVDRYASEQQERPADDRSNGLSSPPEQECEKRSSRSTVCDDGAHLLTNLWASTEKAAAKARVDVEQERRHACHPRQAGGASPRRSTPPRLHHISPLPTTPASAAKSQQSSGAGVAALSDQANSARQILLQSLGDMMPADCILLSGGLDTCILAEGAHLLSPGGFKVGITVSAGTAATDGPFAEAVAKRCGMEHIVIGGSEQGNAAVSLLEQELDFVVETLKTFDPMEIRNSVAVAAALREASCRGFTSAITGDGADELFAGYNFMHSMTEEKFNSYQRHLVNVMQFSAVALGAALGIEVRQPFLHPKVREYASKLSRASLIGTAGNGTDVHGKLILRQAFPGVFSAWRRKDPIEVGCGTCVLPDYLSKQLAAASLQAAKEHIQKQEQVHIRDAEHLLYYLAFKRVFKNQVPPGMTRWASDPCFACGYQLSSPDQTFCITCGQYPARKPADAALSQCGLEPAHLSSVAAAGMLGRRLVLESLWLGLAGSAAIFLVSRLFSRR